MQPFELTLSNNGTVTGLQSIPPSSAVSTDYRPLVVGLHGGGYDSQYFDATPNYSASLTSIAFGVPFVSIDRPSYGGTSSILPIPEGSDFPQETGIWLHSYILPEIWTEFGVPNKCNCVVLFCHSLGGIGGIVAAALHAQDKTPSYPLGGMISSGLGNEQPESMKNFTPSFLPVDTDHGLFPVDDKDAVMFKPGTVAPEVLEQSERLNAVSPYAETPHFAPVWLPKWKEQWAAHVSVPVMLALVEGDPFFVASEEELETCARAFKNSVRVDKSLVRGAPHCMELSHWSRGWYARSFGFALECSTSFAHGGTS